MAELFCKTTSALHIEGRGTCVFLGDSVGSGIPATEAMKLREMIRILRPDQSSVKTFVKGLDDPRKAGVGRSL